MGQPASSPVVIGQIDDKRVRMTKPYRRADPRVSAFQVMPRMPQATFPAIQANQIPKADNNDERDTL